MSVVLSTHAVVLCLLMSKVSTYSPVLPLKLRTRLSELQIRSDSLLCFLTGVARNILAGGAALHRKLVRTIAHVTFGGQHTQFWDEHTVLG